MKMWKYPAFKSNIRLAVAGWISGVCLFAHCAETTSDIVIYGSSPAAISAAVQAKRMGKSAVIVSPESRIGGLTTGGLGQTDIGNKKAFGGIALEFYRDVAKWYAESAHWTRQTPEQYKPDGQTAGTMGKDSMWTFEPSAALAILEGWEKRDKLDIRRGEWLDRDGGVTKEGGRIVSIKTLSGNVYRGKVFVDATYEGDLMAAAGVSYTVGREANSVYGETISGIQFREARAHQLKWHVSAYVEEGNPESGLLPGIEPRNPDEKDGDGDKRVQAYCFRMCLTDGPANRIPFKKPVNYDEKEYELLFRNFAKGEGAVPWINSKMPNRKTDTNNKLGFSTDFIGRNYEWPEASYERRAEIFKAHLDYQKGLMWTLANHPRVPEKIRAEVSKWGTCKDEFLDGPGDGWQSQLYVREARRMVGEYVMTEHECRGDRKAPRPVAMGAYTMDSHNVRRVITARGNVQNEGDVQDRGRYSAWGPDADKRAKGGRMKPYGIDYGAICPKRGECENLLVPVCLSASHMAFGSIRMEPVFFALGQVAGTAASLAAVGRDDPIAPLAVQDIPYATLAARLLADGQVMELKTSASGRACAASVAPSAKFTDGMLSKTRPAGWLAEACRVQAEGLCGHPEALSYPYDTCLWAGEIPRMGKHGQDWWRYEQTAYYVDGLLRLGYATGDEAFIKKGEENIDYTLEHAAPDGHLGHPSLWDAARYKLKNGYDMWPLAVFFRAMKAKYDAAPDERIPAALRKNFLNYDKERVSKVRNVINAEGLLWTYAHTGDKRLLDLAEEAWNLREPLPPEKKNELAPKNCANNDAIHMHGVSYCEEMKVPMILYAYTGKKEYLDQAVNVERKLVRDHMLPDGCPTSAERTLGNSVHVCHETCDAVDYTWSLGYFLEATGDAAYADRIERCVFNAGFGAIAGDFKSLQYFSNVNQFIATSNSDHNPQNHGTTWMQYRPTHETECCAGNVNRILPNYISRMWLKDKDGGPVAALYGPSEVDFGWAKIKEETNYPFDGKVVFRFSMAEPKDSAFTYRVPGWCKGASVKVNGEAVAAARPGSFATIGRRFADGDVIELDLPMDVRFEEIPRRFVVDGKDVAKRLVKRPAAKFANSSQGTVVTRGPLVFAYPIPTERTEDVEEHENMNGKKSANPDFKSWNLKPAGPFNYALAARRAEVVWNGDAGDGFFRNPAGVKLRVSVKRIDWKLDENRFTPDLPERPVIIGDGTETIELVPYGSTMLRLGVFPDVSQETFAATVWREVEALVNDTAVHGNDDRAQLYMAGDSIMAEYKSDMFPQFGWGQALKSFMKEPASLHNFARSGWSARRFRESGRWEECIASKLKPGDWVIVSFGHNDSNRRRNKSPKNDYSTIDEYKAFLKGFADDAKAKGANIAFATSIAHSDGFSVKDGAMNVDGGATGLGPYIAAMREVASELNAPLLDLSRYAEENLPKLGLEKAKALYMFVKPGEYANYPKGKQDAAHIRDAGAFFYAKGAVEMARAHGLSLADLLKDPAIVPFVPVVTPVAFADAKVFRAVSPNGKNELRLEVGGNGMEYSVWRSGKSIVEPARIALMLDGHGWLNGAGMKPEATTRKVDGTLATPLYKKSSVDLAANETRVDFGDWAVVLHARNDGVAWRFETKFDGEITVNAESTNIRFPKGAELCYTVAPGFMSGWEKPAQIGPVESVPAGHPQIVMTPFTATVPGAGVVTVTESDLRDYPGLNFYRRENEPDMLRSWQAGVPKEVDRGRRKIKVVSREPYLAKTKGTRSFPWRVFVLGDTPSDLVESDAVYALATPNSQLPHSQLPHSQLTHSSTPNSSTPNFSWVKPGQVAWDWWNGFKITDVPGLKTGCNFETYKEYVNFAAANGIEYIIMDEGWSEKLNLDKPRDEVNVPGVIAYAKEKGVGVILWAAWSPLTDRETRLRVFDRYAAMGAKGFKIDFIERDDQDVERFLEETAADAAERKLVVMYHGIHKPTGLQRTYPNILNYEGVYGLEQGGRSGGRKVVISNDVNLVYTRMVTGFMDYTPGAMRNRAFDAPPYDKEKDTRACYGTRCHQLALFPLFEAPIQMLCDSPTQYRTAPECTAFITKVPTVWDETVGVAGEIGAFASVARRKGREWWLGAITNWERRELELSTKFLGEGEWKVDAFEDASDADVNSEHYVRREFTIKAGDPLKVRLAPGGGFAARFTR